MKKEIPELDNLGLRQFALVFSAIVAGLFGIVMPLLLGHWSARRGLLLWGWRCGACWHQALYARFTEFGCDSA